MTPTERAEAVVDEWDYHSSKCEIGSKLVKLIAKAIEEALKDPLPTSPKAP